MQVLVYFCFLFFGFKEIRGCYLVGTDSGQCTVNSLDPAWKAANMPFCSSAIKFPVCIPQFQSLPPSREYPNGRFFNHTVAAKDKWVADNYGAHLAYRIGLEKNKTLFNLNTNEFGEPGHIRVRFLKNEDCKNAFMNLFCWINFPRCNPDTDQSMPTCRSACENFFITCGYETGLWRCGKTKYFNGYEPEKPRTVDGNLTYLREYFPGQPFRKNKYFKESGQEQAICTPAVLGYGQRGGGYPDMGQMIFVFGCLVVLIAVLI
mmetsp:Transcript_32240/g.30729  ORF Transcript_32240/g.30729 Transcript_32240/m.30729 type:complete len:262 (-) Transcript_32240:20-805(-)